MECNCNNNDRAVIPWVRGNRLPLVICVYEDVVTQEGEGSLVHNEMERVPYEIQAADTVTVVMKSGFRQVEMPFTTEGNKVLVTDNGELAAGTYTVEVTIVRGDGARGRWQETRQVRIYENTSDAQLGEMYAIEADLFFYAKGDTGNGIADITANADYTLTITMTDGTTYTTEAVKGEKGDKGDKGDTGTSIVSFEATGQTDVSVVYTVTFSDDTTQEVAVPKGPQGDTGLTGNGISSTALNSDYTLTVNYTDGTSYTTPSIRGAQGVQGVSVIGFTQTGETATNTMYNLVFSDGRTQSVAIPKGVKGDKGDKGDQGIQGIQGPKGDTVIIGDEQTYTLYGVTGQNSDGAMTQKAVTDNYGYKPIGHNGYAISLSVGIGNTVGSEAVDQYSTGTEINVSEGDVILVTAQGGNNSRAWGFIDENRVLLSVADTAKFYENEVLIAPSGADKVVLNAVILNTPGGIIGYPNYEWYLAKANSVGAREMLTKAYLYGDLRTFAVGQTYKLNEPVKTIDWQLLKMSKEVRSMNLVDEIAINDLKVYGTGVNASTYKAQKSVDVYDGTEVDGLYAIGRPAIYTITINADDLSIEEDTEITVTINGDTQTIVVTPDASETKAADIASLISGAFPAIDGWVLSDNENGTLSLKCETYGGNTAAITSSVGSTGLTITSSLSAGSRTLSKYTEGAWTSVTLADYAADSAAIGETDDSKMWQKISAQELLDYTEPNSIQKDIRDKIEEDEYVLVMNRLKQDKELITDEYVISKVVGNHEFRLSKMEGKGTSSKYNGSITTSTSDTISIFGSSYGAALATYCIPSKHWTNILNLFSDFTIQNLSGDGLDNVQLLTYIRDGDRQISKSAKYALLVNSENLPNDTSVVYRSFINLAKGVKSFGLQPILGTSHRNIKAFGFNCQFFSSLLKKWCKENNTIFMDAGEYATIAAKSGEYSSHLNERQSPTVAYAYMDALAGLERPYQSLKVYSLRSGIETSTLDNLMFDDNYERARRFMPASERSTFSNYALISAVLPSTSNYLDKVVLHLKSNQNIEVYCMDSDLPPYSVPTTYTRFHVNTQCEVNSNDRYSYGGTTFQVVRVDTENHYGEYCDIYCNPALSSSGDISGTLTKISGSGTALIPFNGYGIASLDEEDAVMNETGGHWALLEKDSKDFYNIGVPNTRVFYDTVHFLLKYNGNFTISELYIDWGASREKTLLRTPVPDFTSNVFNSNTETITEATFGSVGTTLTTWSDENNTAITSVSTTGLPSGCSSCVKISSTNIMKCTIASNKLRNGHGVLEILARNNQTTVNSTSWDWNKLYISLSYDNYPTIYDAQIGLAWRIVRIPIDMDGMSGGFANTELKLYSEFENMEIARVSFKYI